MKHRPEVAPEALASSRPKHDVSALLRHIDTGVIGFVERKTMHRHLPARLQGPLIGLGHVPVVADRSMIAIKTLLGGAPQWQLKIP